MWRRSQKHEASVQLDFRWQPKQWQINELIENSKASRIGFGGARGGSKSHTGRQVMLTRRLKYPGTTGLVLRRTFKEVYANCIGPMFKQWSATRQWYRGPGVEGYPVMRIPNGSRIVFGYAEHKQDIYDFQGQEFAFILVEEATHFNEEELRFLETCNRWTRNPALVPKMGYTTNPGKAGHEFIKRIFVSREYVGNEDPADYDFIPAYGWDNVEWATSVFLRDLS